MSNDVLIKALSLIARTDGGETELNAHACYLLAKSALEEYASQQSVEPTVLCACFKNNLGTIERPAQNCPVHNPHIGSRKPLAT